MKKQISSMAIAALLMGFTGCKSSSEVSNSNQTEKRQQSQGRGERPDAATLIKEMDANDDGKLSKDEVKGPLASDFSKIDSDDDGYITKEELENAPKPERQQGSSNGGGRR